MSKHITEIDRLL